MAWESVSLRDGGGERVGSAVAKAARVTRGSVADVFMIGMGACGSRLSVDCSVKDQGKMKEWNDLASR